MREKPFLSTLRHLKKEPRSGGGLSKASTRHCPGTMGGAVPEPTPVLMGYADRFSVQAGDMIRFMVSCEATSFDARLVRLIHGDNQPAGPGYREEPQPS